MIAKIMTLLGGVPVGLISLILSLQNIFGFLLFCDHLYVTSY
jgi:hypothetical protein